MEIVRDVKTFVAKNGEQLQKFFVYKTGIFDRELVHDHLQEFYIKMIQTKALESYREEEGSFDSYISTLLCWMLPYQAKKNVSIQHNFITKIKRDNPTKFESDDVWDHIGTFEGPYKVELSPYTPRIFEEEDESTLNQYLDEFKDYVLKTESEHCASQMVVYLDCKKAGCNSSDVAIVLGVTDNMVKIIKQKLQRKFERWKMMN